jgi:hypothetical protein
VFALPRDSALVYALNPSAGWTDTEELLAMVVEKVHDLTVLTLRAHFDLKGTAPPPPLHVPRPGEPDAAPAAPDAEPAPRPMSPVAEQQRFFGGGVTYVPPKEG